MSRAEKIKQKLAALGASPKRSLGQNFLISDRAVEKILSATLKLKPESLLEIGPGLGSLTDDLIQLGHKLTLIELDSKFSQMWREQGYTVIEGDALRLDWQNLDLPRGTVLVSNLPYQIAASLVIELSPGPQALKAMVLMFQKEVAQRIQASPRHKNYGFLSVVAQVFWQIQLVLEAAPNEFLPAPKVASRVLSFGRREEAINLGPSFVAFVKAAFAQRRKLLQKNLAQTGIRAEDFARVAESMGLSLQTRAEELSPQDFVELYQALREK